MAEADPAAATAAPSGERGLGDVTIDPFAPILAFAKKVKSGQIRTAFVSFLERWREPIDVQIDKRMDLAAFGKGPDLFLKMPRQKKPEEFSGDTSERLKQDLERQFNLRNLGRFVKTINKGDPLEFKRRPVELGKLDFDARAHMSEVYKRIEGIVLALGTDQVKTEMAWRHRMLEVMQWEQWFSKEIKDEFSGPMWRHDPEKNPVSSGKQTVDGDTNATAAGAAGGGWGGGGDHE